MGNELANDARSAFELALADELRARGVAVRPAETESVVADEFYVQLDFETAPTDFLTAAAAAGRRIAHRLAHAAAIVQAGISVHVGPHSAVLTWRGEVAW